MPVSSLPLANANSALPARVCNAKRIYNWRCRASLCIRRPSQPLDQVVLFASRRDCDVRAVDARVLAQQAGATGARLSRRQGPGRRRGAACDLSAAGVRRRGAQSEEGAGPCRGRRGLPAPGRRLRRELCRARRQQHPRLLPRAAADGGGADLCRCGAGGEGRPRCRPICKTALIADREIERHRAAELSRRHRQRYRLHQGSARAGSAAPVDGLSPVGRDAEPAACVRHRRLRQSRQRASMDARLPQG
ncbi:hypothetical protein ACVIW2_002257 [Bradyrhizobium huanghuaihaiense]